MNISSATARQQVFALAASERPKRPRDLPFRGAFTKRSNVTVLRVMKLQVRSAECRKPANVVSTVTATMSRTLATKSRILSASASVTRQKKVQPTTRLFIFITHLTPVGVAALAVVAPVACVIAPGPPIFRPD
jgi:hypothetical protein